MEDPDSFYSDILVFLSLPQVDIDTIDAIIIFIKSQLDYCIPESLFSDFLSRIPYIEHSVLKLILETLLSKYSNCVISSTIIKRIPFDLILNFQLQDQIITAKIAVLLSRNFKYFIPLYKIIGKKNFVKNAPRDMIMYILSNVVFSKELEVALLIKRLLNEGITLGDFQRIELITIQNNSDLFDLEYYHMAKDLFKDDINIYKIFGREYSNKYVIEEAIYSINSIKDEAIFLECIQSIINCDMLCNDIRLLDLIIPRCFANDLNATIDILLTIIKKMNQQTIMHSKWVMNFLKENVKIEAFSSRICYVIINCIPQEMCVKIFDEDYSGIFGNFSNTDENQDEFLEFIKKDSA